MSEIEILLDNTSLAISEMEEKVHEALEVTGGTIEGDAKLLAPVDTGSLRTSIRHEFVDDKTVAVKAGGGFYNTKNVTYAVYVEMGTYKMKAQPYMKPATEKRVENGDIKRIFEQALKG